MKTFIFALVTLFIIAGITFGCSFYIKEKTEDFLLCIEEIGMPSDDDLSKEGEKYEKLLSEWKEKSFIFNISATKQDILQIDEALASVVGSCRANDIEQYAVETKRLSSMFSHLKRRFEFDADSIF
jgi:hypothetical protein